MQTLSTIGKQLRHAHPSYTLVAALMDDDDDQDRFEHELKARIATFGSLTPDASGSLLDFTE